MPFFKARAHLSGRQEVPPVQTCAKGNFVAHADKCHLRFKLGLCHISNLSQAHLHLGPPGVNGPVVAFLFGPNILHGEIDRFLISGVVTAKDLLGPLAGCSLSALLREIRKGNIYVNVHTAQNPLGEIRGQVKRVDCDDFSDRKCKKRCDFSKSDRKRCDFSKSDRKCRKRCDFSKSH